MRKLRSNQLELLNRLAQLGWAEIHAGPELACARGLHHRKTSLIELVLDDEGDDKADPLWVARLTMVGAKVVEDQLGWKMEVGKNGSWTIKDCNGSPMRLSTWQEIHASKEATT